MNVMTYVVPFDRAGLEYMLGGIIRLDVERWRLKGARVVLAYWLGLDDKVEEVRELAGRVEAEFRKRGVADVDVHERSKPTPVTVRLLVEEAEATAPMRPYEVRVGDERVALVRIHPPAAGDRPEVWGASVSGDGQVSSTCAGTDGAHTVASAAHSISSSTILTEADWARVTVLLDRLGAFRV